MKPAALILIAVLLVTCTNRKKSEQNTPAEKREPGITSISFLNEMHNFGTLQSGETVAYSFKFTNTGNNQLTIEEVESDCSCISIKYPQGLIEPGQAGYIEAEFNSAGLWGKQFKSITVHANIKEPKHLAIFAEVRNEQLEIQY